MPRSCSSFFGGRRTSCAGAALGRVDAGEADQLLREPADVVGDVAVGDFRPQVAALEAQHDRLVDRVCSGPSGGRRRRRGSPARPPFVDALTASGRLRRRALVAQIEIVRADRGTARYAYDNQQS